MSPAKEYAQRIVDAYLEGKDQTVMDLHREICSDYELYLATWSYFGAPLRRALKAIIGGMGIEVQDLGKGPQRCVGRKCVYYGSPHVVCMEVTEA